MNYVGCTSKVDIKRAQGKTCINAVANQSKDCDLIKEREM